MSGQIKHWIVEAARRAGNHTIAGLQPWPPPLPTVTRDNLVEMKAQVADWEAERDRLEAQQRKLGYRFMPQDEDRLRYLRDTIKSVQSHVTAIERLAKGVTNA